MGGEATTVAVVMATQIVFTPCQSAQQQNMELLHGILSTVHQLWPLLLAVEAMI